MSLEKDKWENVDKEVVGSYYRGERRICTENKGGISVVKRRERGDIWVYQRTIEKSMY